MGPDPFNMPGAGAGANHAQLTNFYQQAVPLATEYHGPLVGTAVSQMMPTVPNPQPRGVIGSFTHFMGGLGHQIGSITEGASKWVAHNVEQLATAPIKFGASVSNIGQDNFNMNSILHQGYQLQGRMDTLSRQYKSGLISRDEYAKGLKELNQDLGNNSRAATALNSRTKADAGDFVTSTVDTAATIVTILTAGFGTPASSALSASARALAGDAVKAELVPAAENLGKFASQEALFKGLDASAQEMIQRGFAETVASAASGATAPQIARAAVVNIAFKYPFYYSYISTTGNAIFEKIDSHQYDAATRQIGVNALLALSGGPIGYALKKIGQGASFATRSVFGDRSFIDELSKGIGNGHEDGIFNEIINPQNPGAYKFFNETTRKFESKPVGELTPVIAKNLGSVEAVNVGAIKGGDKTAAAWRVLDGMAANEGTSMTNFSHAEASVNMNNFAEAQRVADKFAPSGPGTITVGRSDARTLPKIGETVAQGLAISKDAARQAWQQLKADSPTWAFAHSDTLDRQIKALIDAHDNPDQIKKAISSINAQKQITGLPKDIAEELSKLGYIAIQPKNLQAPFKESAGGLVTKFADNSNQSFSTTVSKLATTAETPTTVGGLLNDPELLKKYPFLSSVPVKFEKLASGRSGVVRTGMYKDKQITLNTGMTEAQKLTSLRHELQHAVQQGEGRLKDVDLSKTKFKKYQDHPLEVEARQAAQNYGHTTAGPPSAEDIFTKAVQPLPVLDHLGSMLTKVGLSPNASSNRVYQLFNANVTDNLNRSGAMKKIAQKLNNDKLVQAASVAEKATVEAPGFTKEELAFMDRQGITPEVLDKSKVIGEKAVAPPTAEVKDAVAQTQTTADFMLKTLTSYAKGRRVPVSDFRQLRQSEIVQAFKDKGIVLDHADAAEIHDSIARAYFQVPLATRGLGDRLVDASYSTPLLGAAQGQYLRLQGAVRFAWNPFFKNLRVIPKTEFLSMAEGGGVLSSIFYNRFHQIGDIRQILRDQGFLDQSGRNAITGEAVDAVGLTSRNLTKKLLPMQERSVAGLVDAQATRMGMHYADYIKAYPEHVRDTIQMITEYDRRSNFLNSPLARTMNVAIFPFRFEAKVATITARALARTDPMTQIAFVGGLMRAHGWLNSPEGQAWYSQNADAIGLFKYISPLATMNEIGQSLVPGHDHHIGNFGELGGLPFGWIAQILDAEGLTSFNQPGVNPKTGVMFGAYIPQNNKAQVAIAIQDFVGSLFSYPGATIGAPSKSSISRGISSIATTGTWNGLTKHGDEKYTASTETPSAQQQRYMDTVQGLGNTSAGSTAPAPTGQPLPTAINPATPVPSTAQAPVPAISKPSGSKKKKKTDFTPALLPGQSTLGQL